VDVEAAVVETKWHRLKREREIFDDVTTDEGNMSLFHFDVSVLFVLIYLHNGAITFLILQSAPEEP
jgi:hypothetical protein